MEILLYLVSRFYCATQCVMFIAPVALLPVIFDIIRVQPFLIVYYYWCVHALIFVKVNLITGFLLLFWL